MKFKSRKDVFFQILIFGLTGLLIFFRVFLSGTESYQFMWPDIFILLVIGLLFWIYFGTGYELTQTELKYKSGPFRGKIKLEQIKEIIKNKNLWSGLKPATARNELIIKYNQYDEIYISPKTNDTFVAKILELNNKIKIKG